MTPFEVLNRIVVSLTLTAALASPLTFGSQGLFWSMLWTAALVPAACLLDTRRLDRAGLVVIGLLLGTAGLVLAVAVLQQEHPTPSAHPIWTQASIALGTQLDGRSGVSARWPHMDLAPAMAPALAFLAGVFLSRRMVGSRSLLDLVAVVGGAYAALWIALHLVDPTLVLWQQKMHHENVLTGTFLNRNTAAAFLAPTLAACAMLAVDGALRRFAGLQALRSGSSLSFVGRHPAAPVALAAVIACALAMTASRSGIILAAAGSVGAASALAAPSLARLDRPARQLVAAVAAVGLLLAAALVFAIVAARFDTSEAIDQNRFAVYRLTLRIALDHPWIGAGLGQFGNIFQSYRDATVPGLGVWERAHNTYLQIAAEAGFPVLAVALSTVMAVLARLVVLAWRGGPGRATAILGAAALAMALLHSLVDYPGQIPGYAIPLCVLVGYAFGVCLKPLKKRYNPGERLR
jgi:O-antigen ligase